MEPVIRKSVLKEVKYGVDVLRQMQATLSIEGLFLTESEVMDIASMIRGEISREAYQQRLKENYRRYGKR